MHESERTACCEVRDAWRNLCQDWAWKETGWRRMDNAVRELMLQVGEDKPVDDGDYESVPVEGAPGTSRQALLFEALELMLDLELDRDHESSLIRDRLAEIRAELLVIYHPRYAEHRG